MLARILHLFRSLNSSLEPQAGPRDEIGHVLRVDRFSPLLSIRAKDDLATDKLFNLVHLQPGSDQRDQRDSTQTFATHAHLDAACETENLVVRSGQLKEL
jgi:hypothetical protein